jgi:multidrug efflux pump subunit AcrA (membrane-fusion protein)
MVILSFIFKLLLMRKIVLSLLGILILLTSFFGAESIVNSKKTIKPTSEKVIKTVFGMEVTNTSIPILIPANGILVAKRRLVLFSEVQGVFKGKSKLFKTGQEYKKGEVIITINDSEFRSSVVAAKSNLYNLLIAIMPDLRLDYPELYPKWNDYLKAFEIEKPIAELPKMSEKEAYFISGRGITSSYYSIKNLEERLLKYQIKTPYKGILTDVQVTEGTLVRAGQKLGEFIDPTQYELEVAVSKTYADLLSIGQKVDLKNLDKTKSFTGKIERINGKVDQNSQTIKVFIAVQDSTLKEGQFLEAQLKAMDQPNALEIDRSLLVDGNQIYVIEDSMLKLIAVEPVFYSDKKVVLKGVPDGTILLAKPIIGPYSGMLVQIFE